MRVAKEPAIGMGMNPIFIVDDEQPVCRALTCRLMRWGFQIDAFISAH